MITEQLECKTKMDFIAYILILILCITWHFIDSRQHIFSEWFATFCTSLILFVIWEIIDKIAKLILGINI